MLRLLWIGSKNLLGARSCPPLHPNFTSDGAFADRLVHAQGVYRDLLGPRWDTLPSSVQEAHRPGPISGQVDISRGTNLFARALATLARMPRAGLGIAVRLGITRVGDRYIWQRTFGDRAMRSDQWVGSYRGTPLLMERYGPTQFGFVMEATANGVVYTQEVAWLCVGPVRLRLPRWLAPQVRGSLVHHEGGVATLDIEIRGPWFVGRICRYQGRVQRALSEGPA